MPTLLRKSKSANPHSVGKVLKESHKILKEQSISGSVITKSAEVSALALAKSAKATLLKGPLCLDYVCVAFLSFLFSHYLPYFLAQK